MSIICPNMSNPDVAREFNELKAATSERAAYAIWSLNNGNGIDKAPNGAESKLFNDLLEHYGDRTEAIRAKAKMYSKSFRNWFGDWIEGNQKNISRPIDKNGEPLTMWYGSEDSNAISELNNYDQSINSWVVNQIIEAKKNDPNADVLQIAQNAKREWVENRQKQILNDTQMRLAESYGLRQEVGEDGRIRFVSDTDDEKSRLIIDFLDYISGDTEGYYDYNSKSTAAHHVIAISLTNGDPSTFSHELAHHYVRMFWRSNLIQTALRAVDKPGMTDEEREEALVDIITARTNDTNFFSSIESQSFVQKFWGVLANILYNTFGIENQAIRNAIYRNITKAFALNEKQRIINSQNKVFQMANKRMFKKIYREKVKAAREEAHRNKSVVNYEQVGEDKTQKAIKSIVQGSVSRNKNFRKNDIQNPKILVDMQIAEDRVRKFVDDINEYRKNYLSSLGLTRRPTSKQRRDSVYTLEELNANLELIRGFVSQAKDELYDIAERFTSMESAKWAYYISKEVVNPVTGETTTEYLDASHVGDPDVTITEIDFKELSDINQNILGFYDKTIKSLYDAIRSPQFKNLYGEDAQQELLAELTSVNTVSTGGIRMLDMVTNLKACYDDAITERLHQFVNKYVRENTQGLSDEKKEKLIYSINTWLENQNAFGDIGAIETWLGLASNSKSSLIRLMQDMIDNSSQELNDTVNSKGFELRKLRIAAMNALNASKTDDGKFYGWISPFNIDKLLMERDDDGFTGNFLTAVNEGKFYNDRAKFIDNLLYSKGGIQDRLRTALGDPDYELEIDSRGEPMFPEGQDDIEKDFLHEQNHWMGKHAVRRFTVAYYDKRIDMLSSVTRKAQTEIQNQINDIIRACTIDGKVHTELLTPTKVRDLQLLYYRKSQLSNPFDQYGRKKPDGSEEALIAKELTEWNKWQSEHIKNKLDYDAFEEAKRNAKDKDQFERDNTYTVINPEIWEEIGRLFPKTASSTIADLRYTRNKLISIIKTKKGLYSPRLEQVINMETGEIRPGYEEFWANLRHYDALIESLKQTNPSIDWKKKGPIYKTLMTSLPMMISLPGGIQEQMFTHIQKKIRKRLQNKYGANDPRVTTELAKEMENFQYTIRGANGQLSKKGQLSIFSITQPPAEKVSTSKGLIDATIKQPTQAYSVIDVESSDKDYVDERFDATANKPIQPITDDTKRSGDDVSYTNENYKKYIENGPEALKKYYDTLMDTMREGYENIPFAGTYDGRLPQQGATTGQMFHRNKWWNIGKPIMYWFRRHFGINESDTDINVDYELRPDGTRAMNIPVRYLRRLDNPNEINSDVLGSVMDFYEMSQNYKAKSKMLPLFLTAIDKLERANTNRDRQKTFLKGIVNRSFYERQRNFDINEDNLVTYTDKWVRKMLKWIPGLRALTTTGLLALNWLAGLVAYLDPAVQITMDAVSGRYMGMDDYVLGTLKMLGRLPAALISAGKSKSYDKISSGMMKFGLAKTGSANFRHMDRSQLRRFMQDGVLMLPFSLGEHTINAQVFSVTMNSYRYVEEANAYMNRQEYYEYAQAKGIPMRTAKRNFFFFTHTLFDAYKTDKNGEFVTKNNKYGLAVTPELESRVGKRMRNRATVSNLIVPGNERTKIQSNVITAFTVVMRTFMLVGISERFRSLRDFQIDDDSPIDENRASKARTELKQDYWADKGGYNFQTGEIEDGIVTAAFHMCAFGELLNYMWQQIRQFKVKPKGVDTPIHTKNAIKYGWYTITHPFRSRYNEKSKQKREELEIPESDIYAFNRIVSELAAIGVLALIQTAFHNKMIDDGDDDKYWNQVIDHILIRLAIVRYTWFDANTFMDLINSITPSKSDIDKKLKFIDLVKDTYKGFQEHGTQYEDWEKVKSGGYKNAPKAFRDLLQTFSSLGLHNLYTSKSVEGVKSKTKWFKKMVWWDGYWHEASPGKRSSGNSSKKSSNSEFGDLNDLGGLNDLGNLNDLNGLGGF